MVARGTRKRFGVPSRSPTAASRKYPDAVCKNETFSGCFDSALEILQAAYGIVALRST